MTKMTTKFLTISFKLNSTYVYPVNVITGLPAYSDTGYSDIPATVTLFGRPNAVTVCGEACITYGWADIVEKEEVTKGLG